MAAALLVRALISDLDTRPVHQHRAAGQPSDEPDALSVGPATANESARLVSHMSRTAAPYPGPVMALESRARSFCGGPENNQENSPENGTRLRRAKLFKISFVPHPSDPSSAPKAPYEPERFGPVPVQIGDCG
jgi:hypothetical protein